MLAEARALVPGTDAVTVATLARTTTRDWRHDAAETVVPGPACYGTDPELYFPIAPYSHAGLTQIAHALGVCAWCPVQRDCLAAAMKRAPSARRDQVIGGRWMDHRGEPHIMASNGRLYPYDIRPIRTEETR